MTASLALAVSRGRPSQRSTSKTAYCTVRRIRGALVVAAGLLLANPLIIVAETNTPAPAKDQSTGPAVTNFPSMVEADGKLRFKFGEEHMVLPRGLQPSLLRTASGAFVVQ